MQIGGARAVSVIATPRCPLEPDSRHQPGRGFAQGKDARADRRHGEAIEDQRRGVVGKPFAFQDDKDAPRDLHAARNGERSHGVGWRNDRAEQETDRPIKAHEPVSRGGEPRGP
jgi:hypothetical protein